MFNDNSLINHTHSVKCLETGQYFKYRTRYISETPKTIIGVLKLLISAFIGCLAPLREKLPKCQKKICNVNV